MCGSAYQNSWNNNRSPEISIVVKVFYEENPNAQPTKLIKITVDPLSESTNVATTIPTAVL